MQIIGVSRGSLSAGKSFAESLAAKLGYDCLAREELTDAATRAGIPVGKLEMAIVRLRPLSERLAIEKDRYTAFVTATLCERALERSVVYHGRVGHLALPGVTDVLRVRVIQDSEQRIASAMEMLHVSRHKAQEYNEQVDEDRRRWVRTLYNIDWSGPAYYDVVLNLSHFGIKNAASAMVSMAQLPEFQTSPATHRVLQDLLLGAKCRLALGSDKRVHDMNVQVRADRGRVSVIYLPRQEETARLIPEVLYKIDGVDEVLCTMATTNLLWIQERYDSQSESLTNILQIAGKWNAAVELLQLTDTAAGSEGADETLLTVPPLRRETEDDGGILDDTADDGENAEDEGLRETRDRLIGAGCAGGYRVVSGGVTKLLKNLDLTAPYSLVVVGDVFLSKVASVRHRLTDEMVSYLSDHLRTPVVGTDELKAHYLFGPAQWLKLLMFGVITALLLVLLFTHQEEIVAFTSREGTGNRIVSSVVILMFVPIFALVYGSFARYALRLFKFD